MDMTPAERLTGNEPPDVIARHRARYKKAIRLADRVGGVWWDVGCGTGYGTEMLPGDEVYGFDKAPPRKAGYWKVDLVSMAWSLVAPKPDVVVCIEALEHLPRLYQYVVAGEISSRLRPDGVVVFACPIGDGGPNPDNPWHVHEPTEKGLREMLTTFFDDVDISLEKYESTSGPAVQAYAVCRKPK